jgi:hypothetical protein
VKRRPRPQLEYRGEPRAVPTWHPIPGETIAGHLWETVTRPGPFGPGKVAILVTPDGRRVGIWLGSVLKELWGKQRPRRGEHLTIVYLGEDDGGRKLFHLSIDRPEAPPGKKKKRT